jgi:toxin ParE1/3/4
MSRRDRTGGVIVRFARDAQADLRAIRAFISKDNPHRALSFVRELRQRCAALSEFPQRFPLVEGREGSGVHRLVHHSYLIFYRVEPEAVVILRVLHGAQDYHAILFPN